MESLIIIGLLLAIGLGMGCGSYATMPYYRLPTGEPCAGRWFGKRSHCTACGHKLRTIDLFPVFNWLLTFGKCHFCGHRISPVYFFIEFSCMLFSALLYLQFGFTDAYLLTMGMMVCLVILTATDYSYRMMPNAVLLVLLMFGLLHRALLDDTLFHMVQSTALAILIGLAYRDLYKKITGTPITNYAYLKLIAIAGIWFPYPTFFTFLISAILLTCTLHLFRQWHGTTTHPRFGIAFTAPMLWHAFFPTCLWEQLQKLVGM